MLYIYGLIIIDLFLFVHDSAKTSKVTAERRASSRMATRAARANSRGTLVDPTRSTENCWEFSTENHVWNIFWIRFSFFQIHLEISRKLLEHAQILERSQHVWRHLQTPLPGWLWCQRHAWRRPISVERWPFLDRAVAKDCHGKFMADGRCDSCGENWWLMSNTISLRSYIYIYKYHILYIYIQYVYINMIYINPRKKT